MRPPVRKTSAGRRPGGENALDETKRKIQRAAKELIASQGYTATTIRQIARRVSMKGGSLYYHYPGKNEILFAILDEGNQRLLDAADRVMKSGLPDVPAILRGLVYEHVRILAGDPAQFMVVTRELKRLKGGRHQEIMAQRDRYEQIIQDVLRMGIRERTIRRCNVKVVSYGLISLLNGVASWFDPRGPLSIERIADEYVDVLLEGLRA